MGEFDDFDYELERKGYEQLDVDYPGSDAPSYSVKIGEAILMHPSAPPRRTNAELSLIIGGKPVQEYFNALKVSPTGRMQVSHPPLQYVSREENWVSQDPEMLRRQAARLMEQAELIEMMPAEDPFEVKTVIVFDKTYGGVMYNYACIKSGDGLWYTTSTKPHENRGYQWNELIAWIGYKAARTLYVLSAGVPIMHYLDNMNQRKLEVPNENVPEAKA